MGSNWIGFPDGVNWTRNLPYIIPIMQCYQFNSKTATDTSNKTEWNGAILFIIMVDHYV